MKKINFLILLLVILIISLAIGLLFNIKTYEGMITLDNQYLNIILQPQDDNGVYYIPSGPPDYYEISGNQMALVPPNYIVTPDNMGIISTDSNDLIPVNPDSNNDYKIPNGYYDTSIISPHTMAIIPYGFTSYYNIVGNTISSGITLNP